MFECNVNKAAIAPVDGNLADTTAAEHACLQEIYSPAMNERAMNNSSIATRDSLRTDFAWNQPLDTSFKIQESSHDPDGGTVWNRSQAVDDLSKIVGSTLEQRDKTV